MSKNKKNNKLILKGGYIPTKIENIHEHLQELKRGTGIKKSKKDYNRKKKNNHYYEDYDCSFLIINYCIYGISSL